MPSARLSPRAGLSGGHRMADIAEQSGLSLATVDRVLHARPGVSARAVHQVEQAVLDLDRQRTQLRLGARTLVLDVVMQAPQRFSGAVREALEAELPGLRPATVRARFHLFESAGPQEVEALVRLLDRVGTRGRSSQGVLLKAPDDPRVVAAVARLAARGIPVVTLVTDVRESRRVAYIGLDNSAAGATAAYLLAGWTGRLRVPDPPIGRSGTEAAVPDPPIGRSGTEAAVPDPPIGRSGTVLVTLSRATFFGEQERRAAFADELARLAPGLDVLVVTDADGLDVAMAGLVREALRDRPDVFGVYSVGGGNRAIATELAAAGVRPAAFIGHDLDADNLELLRDGALTAVLHHDLRADLRRACQQVLRHHRLLPGAPTSMLAAVQVITPHNVPARLTPG